MARTDAVEATGGKFELPYGSLVSGLGALVVVLFVASLAIGYLPVDLWQGFSDARPMDMESEARRAADRCWPTSPNTLILVFGPGNLVERHSLVVVE